jgi:signal transduction histidine kinase
MHRTSTQVLSAALVLACALAAFAQGANGPTSRPKRVLMVNSFGHNFEPFSSAAASFRTELARQSPEPVEFYEVALETARFAEGDIDRPLAEYLRVLFEQRPPDLVVPIGSPALRFCARHRESLFADLPILVVATEQRHLAAVDLGENTAVVGHRLDLTGFIEDILHILPSTTNISVVLGDSPLERFWVAETRREWEAFSGRVTFTWLNDLAFPEMLKRAASMPPHSAIVFAMMDMDVAGVPYEQQVALETLHKAAAAPIFGLFDEQLGRGIVGGRVLRIHDIGVEAAQAAVRILAGTHAADIAPVIVAPGPPVYDWRELERWNIRVKQLPPGSELRYRQPTFWQVNKWRIIAMGAFVALETLLVVILLANRLQLRLSQVAERRSVTEITELRRELSHIDRVTLLGQFTTSMAHELGQPLGAILRNADAAELFLKSASPDLEEIKAIVSDIRRDGGRAGDVIERLRAMLRRRDIEVQPLKWGRLVNEVADIVQADASAREIVLEVDGADGLPAISGDRVHLQQVLLNLIVNAMDAVDGAGEGERRVTVRTRLANDDHIECAVSDTGPGIPPEQLAGVFDPFFTTKEAGMGMGLPISRTIVEAHGGRIWAENNPTKGATFRFTIPISPPREGT